MKNLIRAVAGMLALTVAMEAGAQTCRSDLNGDGAVNGADLGILLADWGFCPATISSVTPLQGGTQGGTVISITGTGLATTSSAKDERRFKSAMPGVGAEPNRKARAGALGVARPRCSVAASARAWPPARE